jgi:hypothetical protein
MQYQSMLAVMNPEVTTKPNGFIKEVHTPTSETRAHQGASKGTGLS